MKISIKNIFSEIAEEIGFVKKAGCFYREYKELLQIVELRKSQWGCSYSIRLGIAIKALNNEEWPPVHKSHVQCRAEDYVDHKNELEAALNEEDYWKTDVDSRREAVRLALTSSVFYFFNKVDTLDKLKRLILSDEGSMLAVNRRAKEMLQICH